MAHADSRAHLLSDRIAFEWPWLSALLMILATMLLMAIDWPLRWQMALASAAAACLCGLAAGLRPVSKGIRVLLLLAAGGAVLGLLLPPSLLRGMWLAFALLLALLVLGLRYYYPYQPRRVRLGDHYRIGGQDCRLTGITLRSPRIFHARQDVLDELVELADYADRFLARHGIHYVMCCGTVLGALRHKGPMPWDDDVDFTVYRTEDLNKLETRFPELAAEAARDGYQLFAHNDYWKLARKGFWRYPVVDLYRAEITEPEGSTPARVPWGPLELCSPANARDYVVATYSAGSLTTAVFDLPYWDSGFVPAAVTRLFGLRLSNLLGDTYDALFKKR